MADDMVSDEVRNAVFGAADSALLLAARGDTNAAAGVLAHLLERTDVSHLSGVFLRWCSWVRNTHLLVQLPLFVVVGGIIGPNGETIEVDDAPPEMQAEIWCLRFLAAFLNNDVDQLFALYTVMISGQDRTNCVFALLSLCANTITMSAERWPDSSG